MYWINVDKSTKTVTIHKPGCIHIPRKEPKSKGLERERKAGGWFSIQPIEEDWQLFYQSYPDYERKKCTSCNP
ncbi:hypothetical protein [Oceanobacillus senegalensis]|uniref:hypothetical protein n=1 Tax=Oceanobacillus senegalensis TaxID=1936063 RepID=UPI000A30C1BA|nr:hypothetical protein [Oceanobacillus senegalensis]